MIEAFYVNFYLCINIGALVGGMVMPVAVQSSAWAGYLIPTSSFALAILLLIAGTSRYVRHVNDRSL